MQRNYNYDAGSSSVNQPYYNQDTETYTYPTGTAAAAHEETDLDLEKVMSSYCDTYVLMYCIDSILNSQALNM